MKEDEEEAEEQIASAVDHFFFSEEIVKHADCFRSTVTR